MTSNDIKKRLAENIKKFRVSKKITQEKFAEMCDISADAIRSIETCRVFVSEKSLAAIATALNVDVYELFLPVPSSFEIEQSIKEKVLATAKQSFEEFLDSVKDGLSLKLN